MDRDLTIGLVAAIAVHVGLGLWASSIERPLPARAEARVVAKAVYEDVNLPDPEPPPPPPPPPPEIKEPEPEPVAKPAEPKPKPQPKRVAKRRPQPKVNKPKDTPPPSAEPAPLVLSKTYDASTTGGGVVVQTGDDDVFGDPAVEANERNRRRADDRAQVGTPSDGADEAKPEKAVVIVHARPRSKSGCDAEWPEGAPSGRRVVEVTLLLSIDTRGRVKPSRILRSAGEPFDSAARSALERCAFEPGTRDGKPVADKVPFVVVFKPGSDA